MLRPSLHSRPGMCRPTSSLQNFQRSTNINITISRGIKTHKNVPPNHSDRWEAKIDKEAEQKEKGHWGDGYDENWEWYYQQLYRTIPKEYESQSNYNKSSWIFNRAPIPTQKPTKWFENNLRDWKLGKWMQGFTELMNKRMRAPKFSRRPLNPIPRSMEHLVSYKNFKFLVQFLSPGGQILGTRYTGVRPKLQKKLSKEIKKARFLGLIPFTGNPFYDPTADSPGDMHGTFDDDTRNELGRVLEVNPHSEHPEKIFDEFLAKHGLKENSAHYQVDPTMLPDGRLLFRSNDTLMGVTELYDDYGDELEMKEGLVGRPPRPLEDRSSEGETPVVESVDHFEEYPGYKREKMDTYPSDMMLNDLDLRDDDNTINSLLNNEANVRHAEEFEQIGFFESGAEEGARLKKQAEAIRKINKQSKKDAEEELSRLGMDSARKQVDVEEAGVDLSSFDKKKGK